MKRLILLLLALLLLSGCRAESSYAPVEKDWPTKEVTAEEDHDHADQPIPWAEQPLHARFYELTYNGDRYSTRSITLDPALLGEKLCTLTAQVENYEDGNLHTHRVTLYAVARIAPHCAVAAAFEGTDEYCVYTNLFYKPATLGQFVGDLDLENQLQFGEVLYRGEISFSQVPAEEMLKLLRYSEAAQVYDGAALYPQWISVRVDLPLLNYRNSTIWLTEDGHLVTNLLDSAKAFMIGPEAAEGFVGYVTNFCDGYRIVYK